MPIYCSIDRLELFLDGRARQSATLKGVHRHTERELKAIIKCGQDEADGEQYGFQLITNTLKLSPWRLEVNYLQVLLKYCYYYSPTSTGRFSLKGAQWRKEWKGHHNIVNRSPNAIRTWLRPTVDEEAVNQMNNDSFVAIKIVQYLGGMRKSYASFYKAHPSCYEVSLSPSLLSSCVWLS